MSQHEKTFFLKEPIPILSRLCYTLTRWFSHNGAAERRFRARNEGP